MENNIVVERKRAVQLPMLLDITWLFHKVPVVVLYMIQTILFGQFKAEDIGRRDVKDAAEIGKRVERGKFVAAQIARNRRGGDAEKFGEVGLRVAALADTFAQTQMDIV